MRLTISRLPCLVRIFASLEARLRALGSTLLDFLAWEESSSGCGELPSLSAAVVATGGLGPAWPRTDRPSAAAMTEEARRPESTSESVHQFGAGRHGPKVGCTQNEPSPCPLSRSLAAFISLQRGRNLVIFSSSLAIVDSVSYAPTRPRRALHPRARTRDAERISERDRGRTRPHAHSRTSGTHKTTTPSFLHW